MVARFRLPSRRRSARWRNCTMTLNLMNDSSHRAVATLVKDVVLCWRL